VKSLEMQMWATYVNGGCIEQQYTEHGGQFQNDKYLHQMSLNVMELPSSEGSWGAQIFYWLGLLRSTMQYHFW
jgi:hypothetical protein